MAAKIVVHATLNGTPVEFLCDPRQSLLECLRDILHLTGTKEGCNDGNCGACSVLLDGRLVNSCLVLGAEVEGREVTTVEGLAVGRELHPLQQSFIQEDALQCGYCTPGVLLAARALLDRNPNPSEGKIRAFLAGNLCRCTGYDKIVRAVMDAAARMRGEELPRRPDHDGANVVLAGRRYNVVGTRPARHDAADKVTGKALFTGDIRLPGMLVGKVLRSPHAHARILSIDTSGARALPGVKAVVTADDMWARDGAAVDRQAANRRLRTLRERMLAGEKVLFVGHAVAAVAATDRFIAEEALERIHVEYELLPAVTDVLEAMKEHSPLVHDDLYTESLGSRAETPSNVARHYRHVLGDPEKGFAASDLVLEREYRTSTVHQGYIEPVIALAAWDADDTLRLWGATQGIFNPIRDDVARALNHPASKILVMPTETGGAFGGKGNIYLEPVVACWPARPARRSASR
jgi:aldehyde oxidoreductase